MRLMFSSHKGYIGEIRTIVDELQDFFCKNTKKIMANMKRNFNYAEIVETINVTRMIIIK